METKHTEWEDVQDTIMDDTESLVDSVQAPHIYCDGIGPISISDGMIHVIFWARQPKADGNGFERIVVGRCTSRVENTRKSLSLVGSALAANLMQVIKDRVS